MSVLAEYQMYRLSGILLVTECLLPPCLLSPPLSFSPHYDSNPQPGKGDDLWNFRSQLATVTNWKQIAWLLSWKGVGGSLALTQPLIWTLVLNMQQTVVSHLDAPNCLTTEMTPHPKAPLLRPRSALFVFCSEETAKLKHDSLSSPGTG